MWVQKIWIYADFVAEIESTSQRAPRLSASLAHSDLGSQFTYCFGFSD